MIRPYNEPGETGDIYYRFMETQIFPIIEPDSEIENYLDEDGDVRVALQMSCEPLQVTVIARQFEDGFMASWALGHIYFDEDLDNDFRFSIIMDETTARRLFPSARGEFYNE